MEQRKIGEGSLKAFFRQGAKELAQALPAFKDSIQVVEEPGTFLNPTTYDVSKQTGAVMDHQNDKEPEREP
jgi:hypothetical protein